LRFSSEVALLVEMITFSLKEKFGNTLEVEHMINDKMIELVFSLLPKMWKDYDLYTFPYLKSKKMAA
jgi:hypothetical protein